MKGERPMRETSQYSEIFNNEILAHFISFVSGIIGLGLDDISWTALSISEIDSSRSYGVQTSYLNNHNCGSFATTLSCGEPLTTQITMPPPNCFECGFQRRFPLPDGTLSLYCSRTCLKTARQNNMGNRFCHYCKIKPTYVDRDGKESNYCSRACKNAATNGGPSGPSQNTNTCVVCRQRPRWIDRDGRQTPYCSRTCQANAGPQSGSSGGQSSGDQSYNSRKQCEYCHARDTYVDRKGKKSNYCSIRCRDAHASSRQRDPTLTLYMASYTDGQGNSITSIYVEEDEVDWGS